MKKQRIFPIIMFVIGTALLNFNCVERNKIRDPGPDQGRSSVTVPNDPELESVRSKIIDLVAEDGIPSIAVAVAEAGTIIWEEAFGTANRELGIKATPDTMYSLASISKPMTATAVMTLVEKGIIDLDKPINQYLGPAKLIAYEGRASEATLRRILRHTAGLPLHWNYFYANDPYRPPEMEETIRRYGILVTVPGQIYQYSNMGYGILGNILSRLSGKSYSEVMESDVFRPLSMTHSSVGIGGGLEAYAAQRYEPDGRAIPFYDFDHPGASAVFSSVHDLIRFGMFHLKNRRPDQIPVLTDESIDLMREDEDSEYPGNEYRLGFRVIENDCGYHTVSHTGGMEGVSTEIKLVPSENIAVAVLCNSKDDRIYELDNEILAAMLPDYARKLKIREKERVDAVSTRDVRLPSDLMGEWSGMIKTYCGTQSVTMRFQDDSDVRVRLDGQKEAVLNNVSFRDGVLTGRFEGTIETPDAARFPHTVTIKLKLYSDSRMTGHANADSGRWFSIGSWMSLHKSGSGKTPGKRTGLEARP